MNAAGDSSLQSSGAQQLHRCLVSSPQLLPCKTYLNLHEDAAFYFLFLNVTLHLNQLDLLMHL